MNKQNNPISLREPLIAISIGVIMLVFGIIFDFQISSAIYDPINTSYFGIIMSGICELPVCFALALGGTLLIIGRNKENKTHTILSYIIGITAIILGAYYVYDTFLDIAKFQSTQNYELLIIILGIVFAVAFVSLTVFFTFKFTKNYEDKKKLFIFGFYMLVSVALVAALATGFKYLWSRPRPRYIFSEENPQELFHPLWILNPFKALKEGNNFKSFPSGHTTYASLGMFIFPYLGFLFDKDKKINITLFYIGLVWALLAALSRIVAGAHFLSDVSFGLLITSCSGLLINKIMFRKKGLEIF